MSYTQADLSYLLGARMHAFKTFTAAEVLVDTLRSIDIDTPRVAEAVSDAIDARNKASAVWLLLSQEHDRIKGLLN